MHLFKPVSHQMLNLDSHMARTVICKEILLLIFLQQS